MDALYFPGGGGGGSEMVQYFLSSINSPNDNFKLNNQCLKMNHMQVCLCECHYSSVK